MVRAGLQIPAGPSGRSGFARAASAGCRARQDLLQQRRLREILADQIVDPRIARQQGAVGMKHRNGGAGSERHGSEEFFVIDRVDTPRHHAEEDAVFAPQSMGDDGVQIAVEIAANRLGQNGRRSRIELEALEIAPLGNVEARRRQRPRPVDHVAIGIVDGNVAEIGQHAGLGAQHFMRFGPSAIRCRKASCEAMPEICSRAITSAAMVSESSNCWSKWRVSSRTVFSSSRSLLSSARSRNSAGHHDGADEDRRDQQSTAKGQPQHGAADRHGQMPSDRLGPGPDFFPTCLKEIAHFPLLPGIYIQRHDAISG